MRDVGAHKTEEGSNCESLIAVSNDLEVDAVLVVQVGEERHGRVDGDHKQDPYYMALFVGSKVMCCVHENEEEGHCNGNESKDGRQPESQPVEGVVMPDRNFSDRLILECGVALGPAHLVKREGGLTGLLGAHSHRSGGETS